MSVGFVVPATVHKRRAWSMEGREEGESLHTGAWLGTYREDRRLLLLRVPTPQKAARFDEMQRTQQRGHAGCP